MRPKHHGIASVIILILGLIAAGGYYGTGSFKTISGRKMLPVKKVPEIKLPNPAIIQKIGQLERRMEDLARFEKDLSAPVDLSLFGVFGKDRKPQVTGKGSNLLSAIKSYELSLAFYSPKRRFCIIDGNVYEEGQSLPDGTKILKIKSHRVLIKTLTQEKWLALIPYEKRKKKKKRTD